MEEHHRHSAEWIPQASASENVTSPPPHDYSADSGLVRCRGPPQRLFCFAGAHVPDRLGTSRPHHATACAQVPPFLPLRPIPTRSSVVTRSIHHPRIPLLHPSWCTAWRPASFLSSSLQDPTSQRPRLLASHFRPRSPHYDCTRTPLGPCLARVISSPSLPAPRLAINAAPDSAQSPRPQRAAPLSPHPEANRNPRTLFVIIPFPPHHQSSARINLPPPPHPTASLTFFESIRHPPCLARHRTTTATSRSRTASGVTKMSR